MSAVSRMGTMRAIGALPFQAPVKQTLEAEAQPWGRLWAPAARRGEPRSPKPSSPSLQAGGIALEMCLGWRGGIVGTVLVHLLNNPQKLPLPVP